MTNINQSCSAGIIQKNASLDTRKVQITGKSTFIITLPKKWALNSRMRAGSEVGFSYQEDGSVLLIPPGFTREQHSTKIICANRSTESIERDILALYNLGSHHSIEVHGEQITYECKNRIKELCKHLIGFEIMEVSSDRITIQNVLNTEEYTIEKAAKRMFSLAFLLFEDLIKILNEKDTILYREMTVHSMEIDRIYYLMSRIHTEKMNANKFSEKNELTLTQAFYHRLATENIDRIDDNLTKIALYFENGNDSWELTAGMTELCCFLQEMFRDVYESFKLADSELANNVIAKSTELDPMIRTCRENADININPLAEIMYDSCGRIRDHILKIANLSIELSHL
ncbi:phosphate uptake regulator PhoU [uncultured Methanolobus sp.]|uniref:phosphate uptake regulator PhoU n=1 Tax=uncultured Methanolobus sp. TaxID=218300 RepID=UPI002AAB1D2E|nr:phosphate uptake regulator PhoU [uncultured Methanolobus sp.]